MCPQGASKATITHQISFCLYFVKIGVCSSRGSGETDLLLFNWSAKQDRWFTLAAEERTLPHAVFSDNIVDTVFFLQSGFTRGQSDRAGAQSKGGQIEAGGDRRDGGVEVADRRSLFQENKFY